MGQFTIVDDVQGCVKHALWTPAVLLARIEDASPHETCRRVDIQTTLH